MVGIHELLDGAFISWFEVSSSRLGFLAQFIYVLTPVVNLPGSEPDRAVALQVMQIFLAFSGGFADRLFLKKLVDATWKISGLTPANEK